MPAPTAAKIAIVRIESVRRLGCQPFAPTAMWHAITDGLLALAR